MSAAGWHPDPEGRHEYRYWDGNVWTEHVSNQGNQSVSPLGAGPADAGASAGAAGGFPQQQQTGGGGLTPQPAVGGDPWAGLSGDLDDGTFSEVEGIGPQKQNSKLLRVRIAEPFMAKQGSMVAYQGNVDFQYSGGGAAKFLKKAITGEGLSLMGVSGQGDVFLADTGKHVHILKIENGGLSVNGNAVLAFSSSLDWNVERVKGGSMVAGGLFNTTLRGTGWVAITTDGEPVVLNPAEAATYADANALIAWSLGLQTSIKSSFTAGSLIGRGSGEAFQVAFQGAGFVIVQPSEGPQVPTAS